MTMRDDFAVFILTHGRAKQQKTLETLSKCGYSGKWFLIIDDEDEQKNIYHERYVQHVIEFSKREIEGMFDTMTNAKEYRSVVYARNAVYDIAKRLGIRFAFTFDDDITDLQFRVVKDNKLKGFKIHHIERLFASMVDYMDSAKLAILGFSQAGAYVGGAKSKKYQEGCQRNLSQAFMVNAENPVFFRGVFNEDLHACLDCAVQGRTALATMLVSITSPERMSNAGGNFDLYKDNSTYQRDFYSKMVYPSVVSFGEKKQEIKMLIKSSAFAPMILNERYKKAVKNHA